MTRTCAVKGCSHGTKGKKCVLSHFPKNLDLCKKWIKVLGDSKLLVKSHHSLQVNKFVCSCHFDRDSYQMCGSVKQKKPDAVPTKLDESIIPLSDSQLKGYPYLNGVPVPAVTNRIAIKRKFPLHISNKENCFDQDLQVADVDCLQMANKINIRMAKQKDSAHSDDLVQVDVQDVTKSNDLNGKETQNTDSIVMSMPGTAANLQVLYPSEIIGECENTENVSLSRINTQRTLHQQNWDHASLRAKVKHEHIRIVAEKRVTNRKIANHLGVATTSLTPTKRRLCAELRRKDKEIELLNEKMSTLEKELSKWRKPEDFYHTVVDLIDCQELKTLVTSYFRNKNKKRGNGNRYAQDDMVSAISLFKRGPKAYHHLEKRAPVPDSRTLRRKLQKFTIDTGSNPLLLSCMKKQSASLHPEDKYVLSFDEMSLKVRLSLSDDGRKVQGYEDFGEENRSDKLVDHALVFFMTTCGSGLKQPLSYYFCSKTTPAVTLKELIIQNIKDVEETGMKVVATVCDQGSTNLAAIRKLQEETPIQRKCVKKSSFRVAGIDRNIYNFFDIAHLIKTFRNCFCGDVNAWMRANPKNINKFEFKGNILKWNQKTAQWKHIIDLYLFNPNVSFKLRLTEEHIFPNGKAKMKVQTAAEIFSQTIAKALREMANLKLHNEVINYVEYGEIRETAAVIEEIDYLFDITNGTNKSNDKKISTSRAPLSEHSGHEAEWSRYEKIIRNNLHYEYSNKTEIKNGLKNNVRVRTPTPEGFGITLAAFRNLWLYLKSEGFKMLNQRRATQDGLESMFGGIRSLCGDCHNPTAVQFRDAFKTILITRYYGAHKRGSNVEGEEDTHSLVNIRDILQEKNVVPDINSNFHNFEDKADSQSTEPALQNTLISLEDCYGDFDEFPVSFEVSADETNSFRQELSVDELLTLEQNVSHYLIPADKFFGANFIAEKLLHKILPAPCDLCTVVLKDSSSKFGISTAFFNFIFKAIDTYERNVYPNLYVVDILNKTAIRIKNECSFDFLQCTKEHRQLLEKQILTEIASILIKETCRKVNTKFSLAEAPGANAIKIAQQKGIAK